MADSTFDTMPSGTPAWVDRIQVVASALARGIHPAWIAAAAIVGVTALGLVAAQSGEAQLQRELLTQLERTAALESALGTQQHLDARSALQLEDLRARAAEQLASLGSTEGLLK